MPPEEVNPVVAFAKRHWFLIAVAGVALAAQTANRSKKCELSAFSFMADLGLVLTPLVGIATLRHLAHQDHQMAKLAASIPAAPSPT